MCKQHILLQRAPLHDNVFLRGRSSLKRMRRNLLDLELGRTFTRTQSNQDGVLWQGCLHVPLSRPMQESALVCQIV